MTAKLYICVILAVLALSATSATATAADGPYLSGYSTAQWWGYMAPSIYVREHIPYFALHPPVYYSYPVPRPYGYSPYAYPPGTETPKVKLDASAVIQNKYVPRRALDNAPADRQARTPLRITNPYVQPAAELAAVPSGRRPEVVYPAATTGQED